MSIFIRLGNYFTFSLCTWQSNSNRSLYISNNFNQYEYTDNFNGLNISLLSHFQVNIEGTLIEYGPYLNMDFGNYDIRFNNEGTAHWTAKCTRCSNTHNHFIAYLLSMSWKNRSHSAMIWQPFEMDVEPIESFPFGLHFISN